MARHEAQHTGPSYTVFLFLLGLKILAKRSARTSRGFADARPISVLRDRRAYERTGFLVVFRAERKTDRNRNARKQKHTRTDGGHESVQGPRGTDSRRRSTVWRV